MNEQKLTFEEKKECLKEEVELIVSDKSLTGDPFNKWEYPVAWGNEYWTDVYGNNKEEAMVMAIEVIAHDWEIEDDANHIHDAPGEEKG